MANRIDDLISGPAPKTQNGVEKASASGGLSNFSESFTSFITLILTTEAENQKCILALIIG